MNKTSFFDAHCHIGKTPYLEQKAEDLLNKMDQNNVEKAVICAFGSHIVCKNKEGNDFISDWVKKYPLRFVGFASVNPWYEAEAIIELKRSITELGLIGLKLHPVLQGFQANDKIVNPLIETAIQLNIPIFIHSGTPMYSLPLQIFDLAKKYPDGKFILGHMGGADFYFDIPTSFSKIDNVYLETSLTCHSGYVAEAINKIGYKRILFGSDSPVSEIDAELAKIRVLNLSDNEWLHITRLNIENLLLNNLN